MIPTAAIAGLVLAGGLGRRMSVDGRGTDKGLQLFRREPLVAHAIRRLRPQVGSLMINANRHLDIYRGFGHPVVCDDPPDQSGPLAGLASAWAATDAEWLATVPCDSPLLPDDLVERLARAAAGHGADIAVASAGGREQPVFLLAHRRLAPGLARYLADGHRRIDQWYAGLQACIVDFDDVDAFRNINTLDELRAIE